MNSRHAIILAILILALPLFALGQAQEEQGKTWGDYAVKGSIEMGGRIADAEGNQQMYSTLVDLNSGPRFLEQELSMESLSRQGLIFDNLYLSSFGLGGDPDGMIRLRMNKAKWYNFLALYRRDKNIFDYNLFGNPLNMNQGITTCGPTCTNQFAPSAIPWYTDSTRLQAVTRNMGDFSLTLLPESNVSVRLGYARNASYGLIYTTMETPIRSQLSEDAQWKSDRYQIGVDLKMLPRTTISADFFFEHDKNDINLTDAVNLLYTLGTVTAPGPPPTVQQVTFNGQPLQIDTGLLYPPLGGTLNSCAGANTQTIFTGNLFLLNAGCNGLLVNTGVGGSSRKNGNVRTDIPTGQLSLQSRYFRDLDITASASYSSASSDYLNFTDFAHLNSNIPGAPTAPATVSTSNSGLFLVTGAPTADHISANADLGVTYHITKSLSVSDKFRWLTWHESGAYTQSMYGCWLQSNQAFASAVGTTGTFTQLLNPCNSGILTLINPSGGGLITTCDPTAPVSPACPAAGSPGVFTQGSVRDGRGNYQQIAAFNTVFGERSYFNTFKVNWAPNRLFSGYIGYRFARRSFQDGNADITGIVNEVTSNFVNDGTGNPPTVPRCNVNTTGCDLTTGIITLPGDVDSEPINQHTGLAGFVLRPVESWRINADVEIQYSDNFFTTIYPRHQQRFRLYSTYKPNKWGSLHGGVHFVESRNNFAFTEIVEGVTPETPLFPATFISDAYGNKNHWRYYTLGATFTPNQKITVDLGWTLQDQLINSPTCMPIPNNSTTPGAPPIWNGFVTPPPACNNSGTARALLLRYQETTNAAYFNISYHPFKRVTFNFGYDVTGDNGSTNWLRSDTLQPLQVVGDIYGNTPPLSPPPGGNPIAPCPGPSVAAGCVFAGPFPDQPLGPQAINWHKAFAGVDVEVVKGVLFKGVWNYYDYNSKDHPPSLSLLTVTSRRDFHANTGTLSLRYSF